MGVRHGDPEQHRHGSALLSGSFTDPARAQHALDALISGKAGDPADLDVAFYGSGGEYLVLVAARTPRTEASATRVLREHGAVQAGPLQDWLSDRRPEVSPDAGRTGRQHSEERALPARWASLGMLLVDHKLLDAGHLLALVIASGGRSGSGSSPERRQWLRAADAELRAVSERLEAALRVRQPDLFDRKGRLRTTELTRRLAERTGGKKMLSGSELRALEDASDAAAARSARAP